MYTAVTCGFGGFDGFGGSGGLVVTVLETSNCGLVTDGRIGFVFTAPCRKGAVSSIPLLLTS